MSELRIGFGTDRHRLDSGESLIIGGETIQSDRGTVAHSDGDVLIHSMIDALIGAAGWGDIGIYFPDDEEQWKNACSLRFLTEITEELDRKGYSPINLDTTLHVEDLRMDPYRKAMRENCQSAFHSESPPINIKFKTGEGVGPVGEGRLVKAQTVCLLTV